MTPIKFKSPSPGNSILQQYCRLAIPGTNPAWNCQPLALIILHGQRIPVHFIDVSHISTNTDDENPPQGYVKEFTKVAMKLRFEKMRCFVETDAKAIQMLYFSHDTSQTCTLQGQRKTRKARNQSPKKVWTSRFVTCTLTHVHNLWKIKQSRSSSTVCRWQPWKPSVEMRTGQAIWRSQKSKTLRRQNSRFVYFRTTGRLIKTRLQDFRRNEFNSYHRHCRLLVLEFLSL